MLLIRNNSSRTRSDWCDSDVVHTLMVQFRLCTNSDGAHAVATKSDDAHAKDANSDVAKICWARF